MRSGYWQDLTTADFAGLDPERTVALLPVAAVEQHGPHLPLGTDAIINAGLVHRALPKVGAAATVLVLPASLTASTLRFGMPTSSPTTRRFVTGTSMRIVSSTELILRSGMTSNSRVPTS